MKNAKAICALMAVSILLSTPAHAYVDPGSGTLILQILAAAGVGALFYFRQFRDKVMSLFSGRNAKSEDAVDEKPEGKPE